MRNFKLTLIYDYYNTYDIKDFGTCKVKDYNELWNIVKSKMKKENSKWLEYMKEFTGEQNENDIKYQMLEGLFNNEMFVIGVGEEGSIVCVDLNSDMINEKPEVILNIVLDSTYDLVSK